MEKRGDKINLRELSIPLAPRGDPRMNDIHPLLSNIAFIEPLTTLIHAPISVQRRDALSFTARRLRRLERVEQGNKFATRLLVESNSAKGDIARGP